MSPGKHQEMETDTKAAVEDVVMEGDTRVIVMDVMDVMDVVMDVVMDGVMDGVMDVVMDGVMDVVMDVFIYIVIDDHGCCH